MSDNTAINIGMSPEASVDLHKSIKLILNSAAGDAVKITALNILRDSYKIENVTIHGCTFKYGDSGEQN